MHPTHDLEKELGKPSLPEVGVGDTVEVHYLIREGDKERVQLFIGTVIALKGRGIRRAITVRRIVQGEGVERIFPLHNPRVQNVVTTRRGEVRRSKLYFLRERVGKSTRLKEIFGARPEGSDQDAGGQGGAEPPADAIPAPVEEAVEV